MQMSITWLINSYLAFCFLLFSMTTLLQLGIYFLYAWLYLFYTKLSFTSYFFLKYN